MASYIDAGSIVAIAAGLALWQEYLSMSSTTVGLLAALGPNAMGGDRAIIGVGSATSWAVSVSTSTTCSSTPSVPCGWSSRSTLRCLIGTILVGIAVGADVPTSLALVGELAPSKARSKLMGLTQVAWSLGPIVYGARARTRAIWAVGIRIVFFHLFVVAMVTWWLRQLTESTTWTAAAGARGARPVGRASLRAAGPVSREEPAPLVAGTP